MNPSPAQSKASLCMVLDPFLILVHSTSEFALIFCQKSTKTNCSQKCRKAEIQTQIQLKSPLYYGLNYAIIWEKEGLISFQGPFKFSIPTQDK